MASDQNPKDLFDFDLPEGLDDDLGGDWESAFQAEDFMLSPEEEDNAFLDQEAADDLNLASLLEEGEETKTGKLVPPSGKTVSGVAEKEGIAATAGKASLLAAALALPARVLPWYKNLPRSRQIIFPALILVALTGVSSFLFFRSTTEQLAGIQPLAPDAAPVPQSVAPPADEQIAPAPTPPPPVKEEKTASADTVSKNRKKWPMPGFFITVRHERENETAIISLDLTLILLLEPGQPLPEEKRAYVRDTIYQFYSNRPVEELRRYALARGEMIRNLESWLKKAWPDGPVASIIFDRYRVIL